MSNPPRPDAATACRLLREYFFSRIDIVAARQSWIDRKTQERITQPRPVTGDAYLDALIAFHVSGPDPSKAPALNYINRKTNGLVADKRGFDRVGSYAVAPDNTTVWLCFDFDGPGHPLPLADPLATMLACVERCRALGIPAHIEKSGSGHGWHLWVFFEAPVPAADARLLAHFVAPTGHFLVSGESADIRAGRGIECFPKQNSVSDKPFRAGNMVWLPFWYGAKDGGNQFYRIEDGGSLVPFAPDGFDRLAAARLQDILAQVPDEIRRFVLKTKGVLKEASAPKSSPPSAPGNFAPTDSAVVHAALDHISPDCSYDDWLHIGMALHHWDAQAGLAIWEAWSARGEKYVAGEPSLKWDGFTSGGGVTLGTLFDMAKKAGWTPPAHQRTPLPTDAEIAAFMDIDPAALPVTSAAATPERAEILRCLTQSAEALSPKEIAERLNKDYWAVQKTLNRMSKSGQIEKFGHGKYRGLDTSPVQMDDLDTREPVQLDTSPVQTNHLDTSRPVQNGDLDTPRGSLSRNLDTYDDRPRLPTVVVKRQLRYETGDAWAVVHASNYPPKLFQRTGGLVRLAQTDNAPVIMPVGETALLGHLSQIANWVVQTKDMEVPVHPPRNVVAVMAALPDPTLPHLETVSSTPMFDHDGSLIAAPGYHREARLWMHRPLNFDVGDIPANPTSHEIDEARSLLLDDLLVDFPFASDADRCHAMAALFPTFVRRMIHGPLPIHLIEAPTPGTGKSLLAETVSLVCVGHGADVTTFDRDENDTRKKITAILASAPQIVLVDNLRKGLLSSQIAAAITADIWTDRLLQTSQMLRLPNRAMWFATANNPALSMENARRSIRIRVDAKMDRPGRRRGFKHNPLRQWVMDNRPALVRAVLTIIRGWVAAGMPNTDQVLGSFESWSKVVGGILQWLEVPGFLANAEELYEIADTEGSEWREFVAAWWDRFGPRFVTTTDLLGLATAKDLLGTVIGDGGSRSQKIRLGRALGTMRDRQFDLYRIKMSRERHSKQWEYGLEKVDESENRTASVHPLFAGSAGSGAGSADPTTRIQNTHENGQLECAAGSAGSVPETLTHTHAHAPAHTCDASTSKNHPHYPHGQQDFENKEKCPAGSASDPKSNYPHYPQDIVADLAAFDIEEEES
ncbi:PriCT-2 domain-containing protein [bacterium]|nr:PriCT-2 domain-containing protein [bacterium]